MTRRTMRATTRPSPRRTPAARLRATVAALTLAAAVGTAAAQGTAATGTPPGTPPGVEGAGAEGAAATAAPDAVPAALAALLEPLQDHPAVLAARAALRSARAQLTAAYDPASLSASGGYAVSNVSEVDLDPVTPGVQGLDTTAAQVSAELTLRPFVFGDTADQADQARVQLDQARVDLLDTLTGLEVQTVQAAARIRLAEMSLAAAREGEALAATALDGTRTRYDKGGASERELRDAEAGLAEARSFVSDAEGGVELARLSLRSLVGDAPPPDLGELELPVPDGVALTLRRAGLSAALAEIGARNAQRTVYPVVQAGYTWNLDDRNSVGVSIESRTLQPKVSYAYQDPGRAFPQDQIHGTFQVGVSARISPGVVQGLEATAAQVEAAREAADAAARGAAVQKAQLDSALARARRALDLATLRHDNAAVTLREAQQREALGLDIPLVTQRAALDLTQRTLDLHQARQDVLDAVLAYYGYYAVPIVIPPNLSEVEP